jgi:hypothetical protein
LAPSMNNAIFSVRSMIALNAKGDRNLVTASGLAGSAGKSI